MKKARRRQRGIAWLPIVLIGVAAVGAFILYKKFATPSYESAAKPSYQEELYQKGYGEPMMGDYAEEKTVMAKGAPFGMDQHQAMPSSAYQDYRNSYTGMVGMMSNQGASSADLRQAYERHNQIYGDYRTATGR